MASGERVSGSGENRWWIEGKSVIVALSVIVVLILSFAIFLFITPPSEQGPVTPDQTNNTQIESEMVKNMGAVINSCIQEKENVAEIYPFIGDDIELCENQDEFCAIHDIVGIGEEIHHDQIWHLAK